MFRFELTILSAALFVALLFGCNVKSHIGGDDAGDGESCGPSTCAAGEVCCNESCGICTEPGGSCIEIACTDAGTPDGGGGGEPCGSITCPAGEVCCSESCGICTPPDGACPAIECLDGGMPDGGESCGPTTCGAGEVCCNASCGICTAPGEDCTAIACTDAGPMMCAPMDARGVGLCALFLGYAWDGAACVGLGGCSCEGADCGRLFPSVEACEEAYRGCATPPPPPTDCSSLGQMECVARFECEWVTEDGFPGPISSCRAAGPMP